MGTRAKDGDVKRLPPSGSHMECCVEGPEIVPAWSVRWRIDGAQCSGTVVREFMVWNRRCDIFEDGPVFESGCGNDCPDDPGALQRTQLMIGESSSGRSHYV